MGRENRVEEITDSCLSEALLFATMCIVGLPVDVHIKDGSVFSGFFYTASVEKEYGIVLKKAKMIKKGKGGVNVANGAIIETLVILSGDLVQVVAKGVQLPANGISGNITGDNVENIVGTIPSYKQLLSEVKKSNKSATNKKKMNQIRSTIQNDNGFAHGLMPSKTGKEQGRRKLLSDHLQNGMEVKQMKRDGKYIEKSEEASGAVGDGRQAGDKKSQGEQDNYKIKSEFRQEELVDEVEASSSSCRFSIYADASSIEVKSVQEGCVKMTDPLLPNGMLCDSAPSLAKPDSECSERSSLVDTPSDSVSSGISSSSSPVLDVNLESCHLLPTSTQMVPQRKTESNRSSKEFKLNPGAKIFCPSFTNPTSVSPPPLPAVANMAYVPSNSPMVPVVAASPEVGISPFAPGSSVPAKFVQCGTLTPGNGGRGSQVSQPVVGHVGSRTTPFRFAAQCPPVLAGPTYVNPTSQAVMLSRMGQLVYMQPVSHDLAQGVTALSPVSTRPQLTPHQIQYPKNQGNLAGQAMQLCIPPPFMPTAQQPYAVPSHIPLLQPSFPTNRPIPVPGSNGSFGAKFP